MAEAFYNEVLSLPDLPISDLLRIYQVDPTLFSIYTLRKADRVRKDWRDTGLRVRTVSPIVRRIQSARREVLEERVREGYRKIAAAVPELTMKQKHLLCRNLSGYPTVTDYKAGDTMKEIILASGIPRSTFYKALNTASYGIRQEEKKKQDEEDLKAVLEVVNYGGFEKGVRQIYMMLPDRTGKHFALSRIRRLLRSAGIRTKIREPNRQHQTMSQYVTSQAKPNLLQRRFRLYRPNQVRLTDVTYMNYGPYESLRAYGSSCIDPVTGKLIVFFVSPNNDIQLALDTLGKLSDDEKTGKALLHSDQGILYMTTVFQEKVEEMGMTQSMSKRGNCWDNAPQESFFSMFKQEAPYRDCRTFEELQDLVKRYSYYYNNDRHQWNRKQMTPVAYEAYMEAMTDEEFEAYLAEEQAKYDRMKKRAKDLAVARNKTLGV
jgi:transposase InsO family protein